jgi:hypothetical protein
VVHTHEGVLFSYEEAEITSFSGKWLKLEIITLSEISQVQKDKGHMLSHSSKIQTCTQIQMLYMHM